MRSFVAGLMLTLTTLPTYAGITQAQDAKNTPKATAAIEYNSNGNWYGVNGPRIMFDYKSSIGDLSGAYVPASEKDGDSHTHPANDGHVLWTAPPSLTGNATTVKLWIGNTEKCGYGNTLTLTQQINPDYAVSLRANQNSNKTGHAQLKLLSPHIDMAGGFRKGLESNDPYGYVTLNDIGNWNNTFTIGRAADKKLWNNFGAEGENFAVFSISNYSPTNNDWTTDTYVGFGGPNHVYNCTDVDRLTANNDITPNPRSLALYLPSFLTIGDWSGELRADKAGTETFVNACLGRKFKIRKAEVGVGSGIEIADGSETKVRSNGEILLQLPVDRYILTALARIRSREGGFYAGIEGRF